MSSLWLVLDAFPPELVSPGSSCDPGWRSPWHAPQCGLMAHTHVPNPNTASWDRRPTSAHPSQTACYKDCPSFFGFLRKTSGFCCCDSGCGPPGCTPAGASARVRLSAPPGPASSAADPLGSRGRGEKGALSTAGAADGPLCARFPTPTGASPRARVPPPLAAQTCFHAHPLPTVSKSVAVHQFDRDDRGLPSSA